MNEETQIILAQIESVADALKELNPQLEKFASNIGKVSESIEEVAKTATSCKEGILSNKKNHG